MENGQGAERYIVDYKRNHLPADKNVRGAAVRKAYFSKRERSAGEGVQSGGKGGGRREATTAEMAVRR